jgi:hypothetical protein
MTWATTINTSAESQTESPVCRAMLEVNTCRPGNSEAMRTMALG